MSEKKFIKHGEAAGKFYHSGQYRQSANEYYKAFTFSTSLYHPIRYQIFHGYTSILKEEYFAANDEDFKNMNQVLDDKFEPRLYRIEAGLTLGLLHYIRGDRFKAADVYHRAMCIAEQKMKANELKKEQKKVQFNQGMTSLKELQEDVLQTIRGNLNGIRGTPGAGGGATKPITPEYFKRSNGTYLDPRGLQNMFVGEGGTFLSPKVLKQLLDAGGVECDYCKKKGEKLFKCIRCQRGFYCSKDCQRAQWRERNHKKYCREVGCYEAGDLVLLNGLKSMPELNSSIVRVVGPTEMEGRFEVKIEGHDKSMSIAAKNLHHLRPFDVVD